MSNIKKLAGQTMWYGLSSIAARLINYLLTPYLTYADAIKTSDYGKMALIYAAIPLLNVLFTYGFETAYFRFSSKEENKKTIYSTAALSLFFSTVLFTAILWMNREALGNVTGLSGFPQIIQLSIFIIALDTLSTIPFARLRQEGRPLKFATAKIIGIVINVFLTWFFISYCRQAVGKNPDSWVSNDFDSWGRGVGIGQIVDPPYELNENEVDVRWPGGRCFEKVDQLLPAEASWTHE